MPATLNPDPALMQQWLAEKLDVDTLRQKLQSQGWDADSIASHIREYRKKRDEKKRFGGFLCCGLGAFLGFLACLLTLMSDSEALGGFFLYGLTSVAVLVIFAGLYLLFE